ncbi:MAG: (2Fe-2S)-binding protein [Aliivibrio sp.]|uniref:(2Fe-2S)-binding protein n=1 Tax=Aliivibrio sp. TaxID=1872443 RepID=UPI001A39E1F2|nr:(2Fe-2S)-binding protein [Aliivibrio sp.]
MHITEQLASLWPGTSENTSLQSQLHWLNQHHEFFRFSIANENTPDESFEMWFASSFDQTLDKFGTIMEARPALAASLWQKSLNAHLFTGLTALRLKFNRVPQLTVSNSRISTDMSQKVKQISTDASTPFYCLSSDPLAEDSISIVVADQHELDKKFADVIRHFGIRFEPLFRGHKVNSKLFWGNLSFAITLTFMRLTEKGITIETANAIKASAQQWYQQLLPETAELNVIEQVDNKKRSILYVRRDTCCLKYKLEGKGNCGTCGLVDKQQQDEIYINKIPQ